MHHDGGIDAPVVERQLDVAGRMGEVPQDRRPGGMPGRREPLDVEELSGREVDAGEDDQREVRPVVDDGGRQVVRPEGGLAGPWRDDDEVGDRVQPARGEVARQRVPIGWEERRIDEDPAAPPGRPEERRQEQRGG